VGKKGYKGPQQASLMQSKWLTCSGQMQARNWLYELQGAPAKLARKTQPSWSK